jgi:hypothetical protein
VSPPVRRCAEGAVVKAPPTREPNHASGADAAAGGVVTTEETPPLNNWFLSPSQAAEMDAMLVSFAEVPEQAVSPRPCRFKDFRLTTPVTSDVSEVQPKPFPHAVSAVPLPGPPKPSPFTLAVGGPGADAWRRQHPAGARSVAPKALSPADRAMQSPKPWAIFFAGQPPPVPCKPATICDANLAKAVSPATLPVVLEEDPLDPDPARALLDLFMGQEMRAVTDGDGASVCSAATTASELPNDQLQIRIATRWAQTRQPLPSIDANQAVCPGIDAAAPLLSTQAACPAETMKAACPASSDVIVPLVGAAALASTSLRAAALGLTQSAHADMPKATRRYGLGVVMPSKGKGKSKGKKN